MTEVIMKAKKKKGKVHYKKDKMKNPQLVKYEGCQGCENNCLFNRLTVHPDEAKGDTYSCNSLLQVGANNV
jgi:hypothetical protein